MANGLTSLFNFSSNEEALREGARRRMELQSRAAGRNVASVSAQSATNPAAIARNVNEAMAVERSRVGADMQSQLMQAQQADQARAGQFVGGLLGTAGSILGTVMPGADAAGKVAEKAVGGITQAAVQANTQPTPGAGVLGSYIQAPQNAPMDYRAPIAPPEQTPGTTLGNPSAPLPPGTQASPSQLMGPVEFNNAQTFLNAGTAPNGTTTPPRQSQVAQAPQQAVPTPTPTLPAPAAMAGVSPVVQGTTPPPPVTGPTATPGTLPERDRVQADTDFLQQLFSIQRR